MKLPDTKKERIQTIALIIIGIVFVIYVSGSYAIKPIINKRTEQLNRIEEVKSEIEMVQNVIRIVKSSQRLNNSVVAEIIQLTETSNYVMKARLGNYLIGATEIIETVAKRHEIEITSIRELPITDVPNTNKARNPFRLYNIRVNIECGMHDLISLLKDIEESNPYLSISAIEIMGGVASSGEHVTSFSVQWPIWRDDKTITTIMKSSEEA
ncbi:MAG: hypothetical protein KAI74_06615 [Kiritimatiellae bacterium]|nr:hypothetical protein [Kiritimatiellia bacterium]